jgi:hypothetical protein
MNTKAYVILFSLFLAACGGGGSDSGVKESSEVAGAGGAGGEAGAGGAGGEAGAGGAGGEVAAAPSYETHSTNISGVWLGVDSFCLLGFLCGDLELTVVQAVSDSAESPVQALTGSFLHNGNVGSITGTKEGDEWNITFEMSADFYVTINQTLSSANESSGLFTLINRDTGVATDAGTASLSR